MVSASRALIGACLLLSAATLPRTSVLGDDNDREAFRRWFTFLAEAQYFTPAAQRPQEIVDCSALVRYAYREALRRHDSVWASQSRLPLIPSIPSVEQYNYPHTPNGVKLFRTGVNTYGEFANAETLYRYNSFFVTRDVLRAQPGDLLFYRRETEHMPFHTMVVIGRSQFASGSATLVVYHTGPDGTQGGEIKRLTFEELLRYPDPQWQPITRNSQFLGVFRWNILKRTS